MSESRICPVCENEIPEDEIYRCPYCDFNLEMIDDKADIEEAKKYFTGVKTSPPKELKREPISLVYYFITGILGSIIISFSYTMWIDNFNTIWESSIEDLIRIFEKWDRWYSYSLIFSFLFTIPSGFLSGYIVYRLDKSAIIKFTLKVFNLLLAFLLSLFLSSLFASFLRVGV